MKKLLLVTMVAGLFASCSQEDDMSNSQYNKETDIEVSVREFEYDGDDASKSAVKAATAKDKKKVALKLENNSLKFSWTEGDRVAVFGQNSEQQIGLKMTGINEDNAIKAWFDSESYKLDGGKKYIAYYPAINNLYQEPIIPVNYTGQVQTGNNSTEHLGQKDYIFSPWTEAAGENNVSFAFHHLSAVLWLNIEMPDNTTEYTSVTLSAEDNAFTDTAAVKLEDLSMTNDGNWLHISPDCLTKKRMTNSVTISFSEPVTADENNMLYAWMHVLPADFTSREMTVTVTPKTGDPVTFTIEPGKNFLSGKAYKLTIKNDESDEWVDLGLPSGTLWATKNVGAEKETDYGNYHSWGDSKIITADYYSAYSGYWITNNIGKYVDYQGNAQYDIAKVLWGGDWVTPNQDDFLELIEYCKTLGWKTIDGVNGLFITGHNGKSIFLPANGDRYITGYYAVNEVCAYWSSEFKARYYGEDSVGALFMASEDEYPTDLVDWEFAYGCAIRPVIKK